MYTVPNSGLRQGNCTHAADSWGGEDGPPTGRPPADHAAPNGTGRTGAAAARQRAPVPQLSCLQGAKLHEDAVPGKSGSSAPLNHYVVGRGHVKIFADPTNCRMVPRVFVQGGRFLSRPFVQIWRRSPALPEECRTNHSSASPPTAAEAEPRQAGRRPLDRQNRFCSTASGDVPCCFSSSPFGPAPECPM